MKRIDAGSFHLSHPRDGFLLMLVQLDVVRKAERMVDVAEEMVVDGHLLEGLASGLLALGYDELERLVGGEVAHDAVDENRVAGTKAAGPLEGEKFGVLQEAVENDLFHVGVVPVHGGEVEAVVD